MLLGLALAAAGSADRAVAAGEDVNRITEVGVRVEDGRTVITVRGNRPPSFTAFRLESPPRLVVDLADSRVEGPAGGPAAVVPPESHIVGGLSWSRIEDEMGRSSRLVIELREDARYETRAVGNEVVVTLVPARPATRAVKPAEAPRPAPSPVAAKTRTPPAGAPVKGSAPARAPSPVAVAGGMAHVSGVDFQDRAEAARVVISFTGNPDVAEVPTGEGEATLLIGGADLAQGQARTLDTSAFQGPVSAVSTYIDQADKSHVRVKVRLAEATSPRLLRQAGRLVWEFPKPPAVSSHPSPRVAGFGASPLPAQVSAAASGSQAASVEEGAGAALASPPPGARTRKRYSGARVDLDFKDVDIHNMLRVFARVGGVNIVTTDDVKGTVTVSMHDVPWDQALDAILRAKGLGQVRDGNLIRISPQAQIEKEIEAELARNKQKVDLSPVVTRLIPLSYAEAAKVLPRVQDVLSPRGHVSFDERTNTLIVSDIAGNLELATNLVQSLDTQTPQVQIEARIVEARVNFARDLGVQWGGNFIASSATGNPTGLAFPSTIGVGGGAQDQVTNANGILNGQAANPNFVVNLPAPVGTGSGGALGLTLGSIGGNFNINLRLSALENTGNIRILSAPKVTTLDNVESSIEQGIAVPVTVVSALGPNTVYVDAKLSLTVRPHITNDGSIVMNVTVTNNQPDFSRVGTLGSPAILKNQAKTQLLVKDGDTAVIGGIYTRTTSVNYNKIPVLGDIPVLGWLFKRKRTTDDRSELLIFITPKVISRTTASR